MLRFPVHPQHRGEFWLDRVDVELSDPFDLAPVRREIAVERPLLVMPGPRGGVPLRMRRWLPFGAPMPAARLFEDSEHFAGVRDYEPGDPMHHVHWRLSAHAGTLQTKTYEPTRSAEVLFALDLSDGEPFWERADAGIAEETIGMASYLARQAIHAGWRAGLVANTHLRRGRGPLRVTAASSAGQESVLFTALARMPNQPTDDLAPILREVGRRLTRRTTVVVLSANPGPSLTHEMERLRRRGSDVLHVVPSAERGTSGGRLMMRSLTAPAAAGGAELRAAVAAAVPAALAEASVFCLPLHTVVTSGAGATIPIAVFMVVFLAAFTAAVALATRYRASARVAPIVAVGAIAIGRAVGPGRCATGDLRRAALPARRAAGRRAGVPGLARADRRFVPGRRARARGGVRRGRRCATGLGAGAHRADAGVLRRIAREPRGVRMDHGRRARSSRSHERDRWIRRAIATTVWIPVAMVIAAALGLRDGVLDHLGSILAPIGNAVVSVVIFVFTQLARPIFWVVDALGIDPDGARRVLDRAARSAAQRARSCARSRGTAVGPRARPRAGALRRWWSGC